MRPRPCIIVAAVSFLVLDVLTKRIFLRDDEFFGADTSINNTLTNPVSNASKVQVIRAGNLPLLNKLVQEAHPGITIERYLGKGGFGMAFAAKMLSKNGSTPEPCVVKFLAVNTRLKWEIVEIATPKHRGFDKRFDDMREECDLMQQMKLSHIGQLAVDEDPSGAGALSECILNCHEEIEGSKSPFESSPPCRTREGNPPFIIVTDAGENGAKWVKPKDRSRRPPADDVFEVLNQVREGIRFMSEIHHNLLLSNKSEEGDPESSPPIVHHDLKWDNVCVRSDPEGRRRAKLIDFGAGVGFVYKTDRQYKPTVGTLGYAPPEWHVGIPYADPPWSFDVYSLGAMTIWALCDVSLADIIIHSIELSKLLRCSKENLTACDRLTVLDRKKIKKDCCMTEETLAIATDDAEIDFTKKPRDYERFKKDLPTFHQRFCERVIPGMNKDMTEPEVEKLRTICESISLLMHPNPLYRPSPSSFNFASDGVVPAD